MPKKKVDLITSYTAADTIPLKMLLDMDLIKSTQEGRVIPIHIQFLPTNKCNRNCTFCSCNARDKELEINFTTAKKIIDKCKALGTKSVTITGGGEPLLYPYINELISYYHTNGIKIGLVTNGILLHTIPEKTINKMIWCRISNDDSRNCSAEYKQNLSRVVLANPAIDWAFSHVISEHPDYDEIGRAVIFANTHNFTHVRLVSDLLIPEKVDIDKLKNYLKDKDIDDRLVIYQGRKEFCKGGDCYICYLKPLIGPDGKLYTCCGCQYSLDIPTRDLPQELCLGDAEDIDNIIDKSNIPFDGSNCVRCYYMHYNHLLKAMLCEIKHIEFV